MTCIGQWRRDAAETTRDINSNQRLETEKQLEARRLLAELAAHQRAVARHVCNSDAFRVSETDSATNRESVTILQLCSTQRRLTGLRPAHPRLSQHSHTLRVCRVDSHLKAPCVTWPARKTIGHAWGLASLHFTPRKWWAGRPYVGRHRRPWGRGQPEASRWRSAARGAAAVPTCLPGREPVSRSRHARSESDGRVAAHSREPGIAQKPPRPGGTSLSCQATLTESTQPRAKGLPPVGDFFIGPECME